MTIQPLSPSFSVCRISDLHEIDLNTPFLFIASSDEEKSLLCPTESLPRGILARQDGFRGLRIVGELDFSLIGILSSLTALLAAHRIPVFAVSTFRTDYLFVPEASFSEALALFVEAGHIMIPPPNN